MLSLIELLVGAPAPAPSHGDLDAFARAAAEVAAPFADTVDRATAGGFVADRLGYAFAAGYRAALARAAPGLAGDPATSFCATESGGAHPSAIATRLAPCEGGFTLDGTKTFATLARSDGVLLVVASLGVDAAGRNRLKVARVPAARDGVTLRPRPPTPFAPEIPHAIVELTGVVVGAGEVLEGDGYDRYVKPFRTLEDAHVLASTLGWVVRMARAHAWPRAIVEQALAALAALRTVGALEPSRRETHLALAGAHAMTAHVLELAEPCWDACGAETAARFRRDRPLLEVAGTARERRREAAWSRGRPE